MDLGKAFSYAKFEDRSMKSCERGGRITTISTFPPIIIRPLTSLPMGVEF
jgi:hypothetical protein